MEEEYRMQKSHTDLHNGMGNVQGLGSGSQRDGDADTDTVIHEDGTVVRKGVVESPMLNRSGTGGLMADDDASTRAVHSPQESRGSDGQLGVLGSIPIIRVSTESDIERELAAATREVDGDVENGAGKENGENGHGHEVTSPTLERPVVAAAVVADQDAAESLGTGQDAFSFTNKRLCERWLDNLFMVLYEVRQFVPTHNVEPSVLCRTFEYGPSFVLKSPISRPNTSRTVRRVWNGKFWAIWACDCITRKKPRRRISGVSRRRGTRKGHGRNC